MMKWGMQDILVNKEGSVPSLEVAEQIYTVLSLKFHTSKANRVTVERCVKISQTPFLS